MKKSFVLIISLFCLLSCNTPQVEVPGVKHFVFKDFELFTIQDVENQMSAGLFSGGDSSLIAQYMPQGNAPAGVNTFLLKKKGQLVLFDAGNGSGRGGQCLARLVALGIDPADVDMVMLTHFHGDHIGGLVDDKGEAVFPNAQLYFSSDEADGSNPLPKALEAYAQRLHPFSFEESLPCGIKAYNAAGHTPGHAVYRIGDVLIVGDLLHATALQIPHPEFCARFDRNPEEAIAMRLKYYDYASSNKMMVAGMHFPFPGVIEDFSTVWPIK